ncbi:5-formyltetrahydrofolate cyclo-ligase [Orbus sturtevantii]|uniref:5-formyltetrahydrofolate cyclo-ligase n=1 Tax=Orbus sturtevantii TaxID=3074109 RepID=UPI00370D3941
MQASLSDIKEIRSKVRDLRRELPYQQRLQAEYSVYQQIKLHQKVSIANNIAIFLSFDGELNTKPIIEYCWQQQKSVFIPVIHPFNANYLLFLRYSEQTELVPNQFGILQPKLDVRDIIPYQKLDIIFTPLVAFDDRNYRIGMGRGYYDRLLTNHKQTHIYPIGLAFACQKISAIPNQPWDVQLPEIISA